MEERIFNKELKKYSKGEQLILEWDRGNGNLPPTIVRFDGFDNKKKPLFYLEESNLYLDFDQIGGYRAINFII
jgi:hypothetical protein